MAEAAGRRDRFPWPGFAVGLLLVAAVHGPLVTLPAVLDEGPFLSGMAESRGAALGMRWLPVELHLLGGDVFGHRLLALLLEVLVLALAGCMVRGTPAPSLALVAAAAYLVHPWRTESFVRLGARGVLLAEVLAASAAVLVAVRGWLWCVPACAAAALAASAQPGFTMVILCAATLASPSERGRTLSLAGAALLGVMAWWFAAPGASLPGAAWCAIDQLLRPGAVGLAHLAADPWWASAGAAALLALMVASWRQRAMAPVACLLFALLAWAASAGLRPPRTGLEYLGVGATPDAWLPLLLLLHAALAALACGTRWSTLPLWLAAALAVGGGFMHGRRFDPPLQLIDHSVAVEPRSAELEVLRAQIELAQGGAMPREASRAFAAAALERVREVLTSRRGEPAARTLEVMALASMARLDVARQCSDRLLAAFPDDWRGRAARAELEAIAGDRLAALRWMRSALAVSGSPELRASVTRLTDEIYGEIRHELAERRWSEARKLADALRGIAPEELPAHEAYVDTFSLAGEWPQALAAAEEHFVRHPRSAGAARRVAVIHQRLGHDAAAAQHDRLAQELAAADGPP